MDLFVIFIFSLAWFLAGFVNGISGLGAAMVALPIVFPYIPPQLVVPSTTILIAILCAYMTWAYKQHLRIKAITPIVIAAIPGSILGGALLYYLPVAYIQFIAGTFMLLFVFWHIFIAIAGKSIKIYKENTIGASVDGFFMGLINTSISFGGVVVGIYALFVGWTKEEVFANVSIAIVFGSTISGVVHAANGLYSVELLKYVAIGGPAAIIGFLSASPLTKRINKKVFVNALLFVIAIAGTVCLSRSFKVLL